MVILMDNQLYAANLGDSHMVLTRNINRHEALLLTEEHKAADPNEKKRISAAGGMVVRNRIFADLAISRALGDRTYKRPQQENNLVSNVAFIEKVSLTQNNDFVILASDGLWDTVTYKEAVDMIYNNRVGSSPLQTLPSRADTTTDSDSNRDERDVGQSGF
jgi:serine/threonine protein phosphatase PrpC